VQVYTGGGKRKRQVTVGLVEEKKQRVAWVLRNQLLSQLPDHQSVANRAIEKPLRVDANS
jgi:hypothetical protein